MADVWELPGALDGERLDRAVALLTGLSRRDVNALVDAGNVAVGGRIVNSHSRRVRAGERLSVDLGPAPGPDEGPTGDAGVEVDVVWSDEHVVVVNKPAGLVVHPGAGNRTGTLVQGLLARFPDLGELVDQADRPGIVHRLDKGTSGLLMVARTAQAHASLVGQLARRQVGREYLALVTGDVDGDAGLIDAPLGRAERDPTRIRIQAGGRDARTRYQVEDRFDHPQPLTLLRCRLETGRTHQIRVHLASIGHPVFGDKRYAGASGSDWSPLPPQRPFLHAAVLAFDHPTSGERLSFSVPMPEDLLSVLRQVSHSASP